MIEKIQCPNCSFEFDIEDALAKDLAKDFQEKLESERKAMIQRYERQKEALESEKKAFEDKRKRENEIFSERLSKALADQGEKLRKRLEVTYASRIEAQHKELDAYREKVRSFQQKEEELLMLQKKMDEALREKDLELKRRMMEERRVMEEELSKSIAAELELKLLEKDKKLEDQHRLIQELKRKSEQGSMQMQGEVQELAIEDFLRQSFPFDRVEPVPKGVTGADSVHIVINAQQRECGKILLESKRTKAFSMDWIDKLRSDQRKVQADLAVIVTQAMPRDMPVYGMVNGIWVCTYEEFKSLIVVLREFVIKIHSVKAAGENKGDKMEVLYHFLTSDEFRMQVGGIVDGFRNLQHELEREKRAMKSIWKKREKQLAMVINNTVDMYGSIKGIAGSAIASIDSLELPEGEEN